MSANENLLNVVIAFIKAIAHTFYMSGYIMCFNQTSLGTKSTHFGTSTRQQFNKSKAVKQEMNVNWTSTLSFAFSTL